MVSPVLITLFFASFAEAIESKKQTFLRPLTSYASLKESATPTACGEGCDLDKNTCEIVNGNAICVNIGAVEFGDDSDDDTEPRSIYTYKIPLVSVEDIFIDFWCSRVKLDEKEERDVKEFAIEGHEIIYDPKRMVEEEVRNLDDNLDELLNLFDFEERPKLTRRVYTFVITDSYMYAVSTEYDEEAIDFLSKHTTLSKGALEVRMAGTFRFVYTGTEHKMVLDNDSGAYTPSCDGLARTKKLLEVNFPFLPVEVLDRNSEQPKETKAWVGPLEISNTWESGEDFPKYVNDYFTKFARKFGEQAIVANQGKGWEWAAAL